MQGAFPLPMSRHRATGKQHDHRRKSPFCALLRPFCNISNI
nr:MAG TPA: hypothetical protein [Caudoviricetes sp.]